MDNRKITYFWHRNMNISDAFKQIWNTTFLTDARIILKDGRILYAHRIVLVLRSMKIYEEIHNNTYPIIDIFIENYSYEIIYQFLKYLYTDECDITMINVSELLKLAKEYEVQSLELYCLHFIRYKLSPLKSLELSIKNNLETIKQESLLYIAENFATFIMHPTFLDIDSCTLNAILRLNTISHPNEYGIFQRVMNWAEISGFKRMACRNVTGLMKRKMLGLDNLKLIRFAAMTREEFAHCTIMQPGLLTHDECISIFFNITAGVKNKYGFSEVKRYFIRYRQILMESSSEGSDYSSSECSSDSEDRINSTTLEVVKKSDENIYRNILINKQDAYNTDNDSYVTCNNTFDEVMTDDNSKKIEKINHDNVCTLITKSVQIDDNVTSKPEINNLPKSTMSSRMIPTLTIENSKLKNDSLKTSTEKNSQFINGGCINMKMKRIKHVVVSRCMFTFTFKVSKPIQLTGFTFFGSPRQISASFETDNVTTNIFPNDSCLKVQQIKFNPISVKSNTLSTLYYTFLDSTGEELICWECIAESNTFAIDGASKENRYIEFEFSGKPCTNHIGLIYFNYKNF